MTNRHVELPVDLREQWRGWHSDLVLQRLLCLVQAILASQLAFRIEFLHLRELSLYESVRAMTKSYRPRRFMGLVFVFVEGKDRRLMTLGVMISENVTWGGDLHDTDIVGMEADLLSPLLVHVLVVTMRSNAPRTRSLSRTHATIVSIVFPIPIMSPSRTALLGPFQQWSILAIPTRW